MASAPLSPKKYIQTRARTLPVCKCLVNKDWNEAHEANVIVMRHHVNGNVTAGIYLVDLLCLGIKDTFYFFNEPEEEIYDRLPTDVEDAFDTVDYALAHNIIYAGHDFAMEFGIEPNKEFAVTKFILEEDNDNIPLIEIAVGDEEGLPNLIVHQPGEWSNALAKLQKNAGEGNYRYTIDGFSNEEFEDDEDFLRDREIDDYELGNLTPITATWLSDVAINDFDKTEDRTDSEKITLLVEQTLRDLRRKKKDRFNPDITETDDYELIGDAEMIAAGITEEEEDSFFELFEKELVQTAGKLPDEQSDEKTIELLDKYADKLLIVASLFEIEFNRNGRQLSLAKSRLEDLQMYPLAKLDLALANILETEPKAGFEDIYDREEAGKWFSETDLPGEKDLATYWLIQMMVHLKKDNLLSAIYYYYLYTEVNSTNFMAPAVQIELNEAMHRELNKN